MKQIQTDLMLLGLASLLLKERGHNIKAAVDDYRPEAVEALWSKYMPKGSLTEPELIRLAKVKYGRLKNKM
nr:hypothetical protein [Mycobacterium sp. E3298]